MMEISTPKTPHCSSRVLFCPLVAKMSMTKVMGMIDGKGMSYWESDILVFSTMLRQTESLRLKKTAKIIKYICQMSSTMPTKSYLKVPCLQGHLLPGRDHGVSTVAVGCKHTCSHLDV